MYCFEREVNGHTVGFIGEIFTARAGSSKARCIDGVFDVIVGLERRLIIRFTTDCVTRINMALDVDIMPHRLSTKIMRAIFIIFHFKRLGSI